MPRENERKIECVRIGREVGWAWGAAGLAPGSFANGQSFEMVNDSQGPTVERDEPPRRCGPRDELNARNCRIRIARSIRAQLICSVCRLPVCRCRRRREEGRERAREDVYAEHRNEYGPATVQPRRELCRQICVSISASPLIKNKNGSSEVMLGSFLANRNGVSYVAGNFGIFSNW